MGFQPIATSQARKKKKKKKLPRRESRESRERGGRAPGLGLGLLLPEEFDDLLQVLNPLRQPGAWHRFLKQDEATSLSHENTRKNK